jgi:acyl dehydratase
MPIHTSTARNFAEASENRIHSDEVARRLGFTGALVPGVAVFGHLSWPLTQRHGRDWLAKSCATTRFLKPAYHGDTLSVTDRDAGEGRVALECRNAENVLLATLEWSAEATQPAPDPHAHSAGSTNATERVEITWDAVHVGEPFESYLWTPDESLNREYAQRVQDDSAVFANGVLHPHAILSQANLALVRRFVMRAWIHTGSEIRFRRLLCVGDEIEVRAVPLDKWERKGHQFIKLYVAYVVRGEIATEIWHTAIFRVAQG